MALEELNTFIGLPAFMWFFIAIGVGAVFTILILIHEVFIMSPFAKAARAMKRAKGLPALIQENNVLKLYFSTGSLPEGLFFIGKKWFVRPQRPSLVKDPLNNPIEKRGPGRPSKADQAALNGETNSNIEVLSPEHREALEEILTCPILDGVGKPLFIGCVNQPLLMNPATVAHADIPRTQEVLPVTFSQTILDALHEYSVLKGVKKAGKETIKLLYIAIAAALVIGSLGIVAYMLIQGNNPPAPPAELIRLLLRR